MSTIVLAEDDPDLRTTFECALSVRPGWSIEAVSDGWAALARLDADVDAVVCDRGMTVVQGHDVVAGVDASDWSPPVVVVSSRPPDERLGESDVDRYLVKPVDLETLRDAVVALLPER